MAVASRCRDLPDELEACFNDEDPLAFMDEHFPYAPGEMVSEKLTLKQRISITLGAGALAAFVTHELVTVGSQLINNLENLHYW